MPPPPLKLFNPAGPDRAAVVWADPVRGKSAAAAGVEPAYLVRLARGPRAGKLGRGSAYGPYAEAELPQRFADVAAGLRPEGFLPSGMHGMFVGLNDPSPAKRGRAAARLGWTGHPEAVDALLAALPPAVDEVCAIVDALGTLGDPRAVAFVRPLAARKLLSRRRSAVEALRNLGDAEGVAAARQRALADLPDVVRAAVVTAEAALAGPPLAGAAATPTILAPATPAAAAPAVAAVRSADPQRHGLILDLLYELATPVATEAARVLLAEMKYAQPFVWRYVKSVLKRSILRHDFFTFGQVVHAVEAQGRASPGTSAVVKSGYDGIERDTPIFRRKTRDYLRRAAWRYLKNLAAHRPDRYPFAAAAALIPYGPEDEGEPRRQYGALSSCYLLHHVLLGGGGRYRLVGASMRFRLNKGKPAAAPAGARDEAYPHLWDARPAAYLRLMGAARLIDVQRFAYDAVVGRHMAVLRAAPVAQVLPMLDAPFEPTVAVALAELERRFDPAAPDWPLLLRLASAARPAARDLGHRFLRLSAAVWTAAPGQVVALLTVPEPTTRALAADLVIPALRPRPDVRQALAPRLLAALLATVSPAVVAAPAAAGPDAPADVLDSLARVCREALVEELSALLTDDDLIALVGGSVPAVQAVAADLLGRRPGVVGRLGIGPITALAQHPLAAVRSAAAALLKAAAAAWQRDPSVLLVLADSDWPDTRAAALDLIDRYVAFDTLGFDGIVGLLDSTRPDVQDRGRRLAVRHIKRLDPVALVGRLVQHPHPGMRLFALTLAVEHLPDGADALATIEPLCRSALFDLKPQAAAKTGVVAFLRDRGVRDAAQAAVAARMLGGFARTQGRRDLERVLDALVRIQLAHPEAAGAVAAVRLPAERVGPATAAGPAAAEGGAA